MIGFDEAIERIRPLAHPLGLEEVSLAEAHRRVLAVPVKALVAAPRTDVSAMDGYAVRDADLARLPARLRIAGESFAGGGYEGLLEQGECVRIFTGAPVPAGADRVVVQEVVRREDDLALFEAAPGPARHIRKAGSDFLQGDILLQEGTFLGPRQLVAAAAADLDMLAVWRRPKLMVLSTGDELTEPGTARHQSGTIPESVSFGVAAAAEQWGASYMGRAGLADRLGELEQAAALALRDADLVVVTGGASVGEKDFAKPMFEPQGLELVFSKVAIKPGKPVWLGRAGGRVVLGLPGNPTSAMVTARLFLAPLLAGLTGRDPASALRWRKLPLAGAVPPVGDRETFARGRSEDDGVRILSNQDSSAQKALAECDLLVRLRPGIAGTSPGQTVEVLDF
ncbi:molybdopterin molybdotransferase MoeA [Sphingosinicella rhizophila]|uniref:Molybdopterin molybdenumtransferase n=1 Tax=Sphingosinicella rhizophila TaxID=3050082 RepID=A0ABU3Q900_9SPHN|nr:molybdopterin molybdotransferase MoeA [Sphingosinicella sp. GR2756]MDT9599888.1 molybdopterin molybdotransferase MoeA [Sphingosinicella sp. GR2756]